MTESGLMMKNLSMQTLRKTRQVSARFVLTLLIFLFASRSGLVNASEQMLRNFFIKIDTLSATFTQNVVDDSGMRLDFVTGHVYLSRPGKFRWDYDGIDDIPGQQLVSDGDSIYLYDRDLEQVTQRSMLDAINQVPSLLLVENDDALDRFFTISDIGLTDGLSWVALKPKSEDAAFQKLMIGFLNGTLASIQLLDGLGNETQLSLSDVRNNPVFSQDLFDFVVPAGVDFASE